MLTISKLNDNTLQYIQPNLTYCVSENDVVGKMDSIESIKQTIGHIIMTERYSNPIYGDSYGIELEQYIGRGFEMLVAGIEDTLKEALTQDDRISNVEVTNIEKTKNGDGAHIEFTVYTTLGNVQEEINVLQ